MSTTQSRRALNIENINPHVRAAEYAVRGELAVKSEEYRHKLAKGEKLPFDSVISANIGNPQQLDQKPITFFRQVLSLLENPMLLEQEEVLLEKLGYKSDVVSKANWLLKEVGSVGAYSASAGVHGIRESVARFIESTLLTCVSSRVETNIFQDVMATQPTQTRSTSQLAHLLVSTPCCISSALARRQAFWSQFHNTHSTLPLSPFSTPHASHTTLTKPNIGPLTFRRSSPPFRRLEMMVQMFVRSALSTPVIQPAPL